MNSGCLAGATSRRAAVTGLPGLRVCERMVFTRAGCSCEAANRKEPVIHSFRRSLLWLWARHCERILYLVVGGWNTLFNYLCFSLLYYLLHTSVHASIILALTYAISSVNGFFWFRHVVFKPVSHPLLEFLRYQAVYLPILAINMVVLPLALTYSTLNAYVIQALFAIFAVITSYVGNKYFTFRRSSRPSSAESEPPITAPDGTDTKAP